MKAINFPGDEKAHDKIIEWWYYNGHLKGNDGKQYAFMDCLFKADTRRVRLPFIKVPLKDIYFSHSILSDISSQKFYPTIDYISLVSRQSFSRPLLFVEYVNIDVINGFIVNSIKENPLFEYRLKTASFDLKLKSKKSPLLLGGKGFLNLHGRKTYYYSLTDLAVEGEIYPNGKIVKVKGKAWMDHQWANTPYKKDRWTWFSLQLDNHVEIICFEYGQDKRDSLASICYSNGRQESYQHISILPIDGKWKSVKTKAEYELCWQIEIPEKNISLQVKPLIKAQEMIFGTINYWEGPISVSGKFDGKKVKGLGFMELVGRPSRYGSVKMLEGMLSSGFQQGMKKVFGKRK
jgi:predicted secreted hydrolase